MQHGTTFKLCSHEEFVVKFWKILIFSDSLESSYQKLAEIKVNISSQYAHKCLIKACKHNSISSNKLAIFEFLLESSVHYCIFLCTYRRSTVWRLNWSRSSSCISIQCHNFFYTVDIVQQWRCYSLW